MAKVDPREREVKLGKVIDVIENQIEHCDVQIQRFKEANDTRTAMEWISKKVGFEKLLEEVTDIH